MRIHKWMFVLSLFFGIAYSVHAEELPEASPYFSDDFSSITLSGWTTAPTTTTHRVENERYTFATTNSFVNFVAGSDSWSNYSVSAKVALDSGTTSSRLGITAYNPSAATGTLDGYDLFLAVMPASGGGTEQVVRLRNNTTLVTLNGANDRRYQLGEEVALRMDFFGNRVRFLVDGQVVYTIDDMTKNPGKAGVMAFNVTGTADDFLVEPSEDWGEPPTYFADDFSSDALSGWTTAPDNTTHKVENGTYAFATTSGFANFVAGSDSWSNYSVSAKVALDSGTTLSRVGITAYNPSAATGAQNGYDLFLTVMSLPGGGTEQVVRLRNNTTLVALNGANDRRYQLGEEVTLRMDFYGSRARFLVDGQVVYTIDDMTKSPGKAGVMAISVTGMADDFLVEPCEDWGSYVVSSLDVLGLPADGVLQAALGHPLNVEELSLFVSYGSQKPGVTIPLAIEMLSGYDPDQPGNQIITVSYEGATAELPVMVTDRRLEVKAIADEVLSVTIDSLTLADSPMIRELKAQFMEFTATDMALYAAAGHDSAALRNKMFLMLKKMEELQYPHLSEYDVLLYDDFIDSGKYTYRYDMDEFYSPWVLKDGAIYSDNKRADGTNKNNTAGISTAMSEIASIQGDIKLNENAYAGFFVGLYAETTYLVRFTTRQQSSHNAYEVIINKYTEKNSTNKSYIVAKSLPVTEIAALGLSESDIKDHWHNLRVNVDRQTHSLIVYFNDVQILTYTEEEFDTISDYGYTALRTTGDGYFDNILLRGVQEEPEQTNETAYHDTFEEETVGESPSHWIEPPASDHWIVMDENDSKVYGNTTASGYSHTWLHGFEMNPTIRAKILAKDFGANANFGLLARYVMGGAYLKAGYDVAASKWYVEYSRGPDYETKRFDSAAYTLNTNAYYNVELTLLDHDAELSIDGNTVLSLQNEIDGDGDWYGRSGLYADNAVMLVDDIHLTFPNGGAVTDGVIEYTVDENRYATHGDIEQSGDRLILAAGNTQQYVSTDEGETWQISTEYSGLNHSGSYRVLMQLKSGTYIQIGDDFIAKASPDMKTWENRGQVVDDADLWTSAGRLIPIVHVNGINEIELPDGTMRILVPVGFRNFKSPTTNVLGSGHTVVYYSDDEGNTWTASQTSTKDLVADIYNLATDKYMQMEGKIVSCSDGSLRLYFSKLNSEGYIGYSESVDYGVTWGEFSTVPYLPTGVNSFNVFEDPQNPGTWYMVWVNNTPESRGASVPRTRLTLAKSTNGKDWDIVRDVDRNISTGGHVHNGPQDGDGDGHQIYQILDPSIFINAEYLYVLYGHSVQYDKSSHNAQRLRVVRFEKSVLETTPVVNNAESAPGKPVLSDQNGYDTGLRDGSYAITMNMWWGNNGTTFRLFENGELLETRQLTDETPAAQSATVQLEGRANGSYTYTCELSNAFGTSTCEPLTVAVTDAVPGKPVLSHNNWSGEAEYRVTMHMWWGTNGTQYRLYENGQLIDTQTLSGQTPDAQTAFTDRSGRSPGVYVYSCELTNAAGTTVCDPVTVTVSAGAAAAA
ncbi:exo-alpha-sialidase [Paenibacillus sp. IB182496]|uniref:Exo-alpha-sialidase n=1 Tax=Paenibacillus sabuli TaxID=2772509 RepID=A0A927GQV3_9BACL|nr:exo-alpha-sialidase [Paenibacillus sabuli]MBD2844157.1 exo-alpha-sialidase [Paenibacillus sabuli]